jgi:aminopeptidase N
MLSLLLALQLATPKHDALRYDITLVPSDTGTHLLGEAETAWRLMSADPVGVRLDSAMRVVRVLVDGKPNTRLSRTMYGRSVDDVVVPHQKRAGDSITTRIRYHGLARAGATVGANRSGERIFFASGRGDSARFWLPVTEATAFDRTAASVRVQAKLGHRVIAAGALEKIDTLPYGHAAWQYRMDAPAPVASIAAASGPYQVRTLAPGGCGEGCPPVEFWSYGSDAAAPAAFPGLGEMLSLYAARAGRFPYARLAYVEAPVASPVAAPGIVFVPEGRLAGGAVDPALALETARQWFGLAISPAGEDDRWITDGLASFLVSLRPESGRDVAGARAMRRLRDAVGDSVFHAGLLRFTGDHPDRPVTRADFLSAMSAAAGRDLRPDLDRALDGGR